MSFPGGGVARRGLTRVGVGRGWKIPPPVGQSRGQGVITGLAARKTAAVQKGISPLNRPTVNQVLRARTSGTCSLGQNVALSFGPFSCFMPNEHNPCWDRRGGAS